MSRNIATGTDNNITMGPAILFLGVAGTTPLTDVGYLDVENSATLEMTVDRGEVRVGNASLAQLAYAKAHDAKLTVTSIEYNQNNLANALGAGTTTSSGTADTVTWGGEPLITELALNLRHYMAVPGHTYDLYMWTCVADGDISRAFRQDYHQYEYSFKALRSVTDWAGGTLGYNAQLFKEVRTK